jgi:hypothetical protein
MGKNATYLLPLTEPCNALVIHAWLPSAIVAENAACELWHMSI